MISGASTVLLRVMLAIVSIAIVALWTDSLLRVTEGTTEVVLNTADLEEFAEPEDEEVEEESTSNDPQDAETASEAESLDIEETVEPPPMPLVEHADVKALDEPPPTPEWPPVAPEILAATFTAEEEGSLASFDGMGGDDATTTDEVGNGAGATWNIDVVGAKSISELIDVPSTQLVAVRQDRGYWQVIVVSERSVSSPVPVDRFVSQHESFAAGQGVVLDRELIGEIEDRLVTYGSGWQLWLLIEDDVFNRWVVQLSDLLAQRGQNWSDIDKVHARLAVRARRIAQFRLLGVTAKPPVVADVSKTDGGTAELVETALNEKASANAPNDVTKKTEAPELTPTDSE